MAPSSFTACCYCGNGIQYGVSHKFCTTCRLRFCLNCQSSHPTAHSYNTYAMTAVATTTDEFHPRACSGCAKLAHSHVSCQRSDCGYVLCTDCFENAMEEKTMHDHDELLMTSLPHRESLDKFEVGCKACREGKAFAHCTRCLEGIQPSSYFYSCMDCLRIYDDVTSTANFCETCMAAVRVTPESLNHRFASFIFNIAGDDESWSVSCSTCHMTLPNLESNIVSRHAHHSWTITMGLKFAETYPSLAVRTCARTSPGSTNNSQYQYNYPSPSPSPGKQEIPPILPTVAASTPDPVRSNASPGSRGSVISPVQDQSRRQSGTSTAHHSPSVTQTQATLPTQTATSGSPDISANQIPQNFARLSLQQPQSPASPVGQQQGAMPSIQTQAQMATPTTTQSPQQMTFAQQQSAAAMAGGYPQNAASTPNPPRQVSMSYPPTTQVMYQPNPTAAQAPMQAPQQPQATMQPQQAAIQQQQATLQQQRLAMQQQQLLMQQQHQFSMRPMAVHAHTAPAGNIQHMQGASQQQQQQFMYLNAQGQVIQAQPAQYTMTQQVVGGQLVNVQVPTQNGVIMQPQPGMIHHASTFPATTQVVQAQPQSVAMVPVRTANGATVLVPQSQIQVIGGVAQVKPGVLTNSGIAGASTGAGGASAAAATAAANIALNAEAKSKAQTNKFMQDLAKVAVGSLVKGVVSGAMN